MAEDFTFLDGLIDGSEGPTGPVGPSLNAPNDPADDGKFAAALSGDLTYISGTVATSRLDAFTSSLKGLTPGSGGGTSNFLRADGNWAAPSAILTPPTDPGDDTRIPQANGGDFTYITLTDLTSQLDTFTDVLQGLAPASGGGTATFLRADGTWATPGGAGLTPPVNPDDNQKVTFALDGDLSYASDVYISADGTAVAFGTNPSTTGLVRVPHNSKIVAGRNNANGADVDILQWGSGAADKIQIGATAVAAIELKGTAIGFTGSALSGAAGTSFAFIGGAHTTITASTESNDVDINLAQTKQWATGALTSQRAIRVRAPTYTFVGASTITTAATVAISGAPVAGTNASITASAALWLESGALLLGTGNAPTSGLIRTGYVNNATSGITLWRAVKEDGSTEASLLKWNSDAVNTFTVGASPGGTDAITSLLLKATSFTLNVVGTDEYTFSSTVADFKDNALRFGTNPATSGVVRFASAVVMLAARNNANTQNISLFYSDASDNLVVGDFTNTTGLYYDVKTAGSHNLRVNNTTEYTFSSTVADFTNNVLQFGTNPAASGFIRTPNSNTPILAGRNAGNSADISAIAVATDDAVYVGDSTDATAVYLTTAGNVGLRPTSAGSDEWTFSATQLDCKNNNLVNVTQLTGAFFSNEIDDGNSGTADTIDWSTGPAHKSTLTGNVTYTFTAPAQNKWVQLRMVEDGSGGHSKTWPASVKWAGGVQPAWSTAASSVNIATFWYDGTNYWGSGLAGFA